MHIFSEKIKVKKFSIHPTTSKAKEALFNILNNSISFNEIKVLDLFCGMGGITYGFASRGASKIRSVDSNKYCIEYINKYIKSFHFNYKIRTLQCDVFDFIRKRVSFSYDLIFADPPFRINFKKLYYLIDVLIFKKWIKKKGLIVIEHYDKINTFSKFIQYKETRKYGKVHFTFLKI